MTEDDDARRMRDDLDAAIGPTPPAPDRMAALTSRYAAWRRRRAMAAGAGGAAAVALIVVAAVTVAVGPGKSGGSDQVAISPTVAPTASGLGPTTPGVTSDPLPSNAVPSISPGSPTVGPVTPTSKNSARPSDTPTTTTVPPIKTAPPTAPPTATLQGTVVNEAGTPLSGIFVTGLDGVTRTDAGGHFVAPAKAGHHGGCLLFSSQPVFQPASGPLAVGDYAWQEWKSTSCGDDVVANVRIVMHAGADVFGTVRDTAGTPIAGVPVYAALSADAARFLTSSCCGVSFSATTDAQGNYRIYGLQPSTVKVSVRERANLDGSGGIPVLTTPGSGQPANLTDFGENCDNVFPDSGCPNAPPGPASS